MAFGVTASTLLVLSGVASADNDGDGANNLQEQAADTNPINAGSVLKFTDITPTGTNLMLRWIGGQSARQLIYSADSLPGPWTAIQTNLPPTAITNSIVVPNISTSSRFYRLQAGP